MLLVLFPVSAAAIVPPVHNICIPPVFLCAKASSLISRITCNFAPVALRYDYHAQKQATREKIVVVSGTEKQQREVLLGYMSVKALEGGRLGCPGAPSFDVRSYLKGGDACGVRDIFVETDS